MRVRNVQKPRPAMPPTPLPTFERPCSENTLRGDVDRFKEAARLGMFEVPESVELSLMVLFSVADDLGRALHEGIRSGFEASAQDIVNPIVCIIGGLELMAERMAIFPPDGTPEIRLGEDIPDAEDC